MAQKHEEQLPQQMAVNLNLDTTPILYTDNIYIVTNEDGIVLNVMQSVAGTNQLRIVARIGMSRTHGKKFVTEMGKLLALTEGQGHTGEKEN
jgi:hypothetical protein